MGDNTEKIQPYLINKTSKGLDTCAETTKISEQELQLEQAINRITFCHVTCQCYEMAENILQ